MSANGVPICGCGVPDGLPRWLHQTHNCQCRHHARTPCLVCQLVAETEQYLRGYAEFEEYYRRNREEDV